MAPSRLAKSSGPSYLGSLRDFAPRVLRNIEDAYVDMRAELLDPYTPRQDKLHLMVELVDLVQASRPQLRALNDIYTYAKQAVLEGEQEEEAWAEWDLQREQAWEAAAAKQQQTMPAPEQQSMSRSVPSTQQQSNAVDATAEGSNFVYAAVAEFVNDFTPSWVWAF